MVREWGGRCTDVVTVSHVVRRTAQLRAAVNTFIPALDKYSPHGLSTLTPQDGRSGERGQMAAEPTLRSRARSVASALSFTFSCGKRGDRPASQRRMEPSSTCERFSVKRPGSNEENPTGQYGRFLKPNPQRQLGVIGPDSKQRCGRGRVSVQEVGPWPELSSWAAHLAEKGHRRPREELEGVRSGEHSGQRRRAVPLHVVLF